MHQSWMSSSHRAYVFLKRSGVTAMSPLSTAASAGAASASMRTNHCSDTSGSITSPPRCDRGTLHVKTTFV